MLGLQPNAIIRYAHDNLIVFFLRNIYTDRARTTMAQRVADTLLYDTVDSRPDVRIDSLCRRADLKHN